MKNSQFILVLCTVLFKSINCIRNGQCNFFLNDINYTDKDEIYLNSINDTQAISMKYGMMNNISYIEAYKIRISCFYENINNNSLLVSNRNVSTVRGIVILNNCTLNETLDLDLLDLNEHYYLMPFKGVFSNFYQQKRNSFDNSFIFINSKMIGISSVCSKSIILRNSNRSFSLNQIFHHFINMIKILEPTYLTILLMILFIIFIIFGLIFYLFCKYFNHKKKNVFISNTLNRLLIGANPDRHEKNLNTSNNSQTSENFDNINLIPYKKQKAKTYSASNFKNKPKISTEFIQNGKNYNELNSINMSFVPNVIFELKQVPSKMF